MAWTIDKIKQSNKQHGWFFWCAGAVQGFRARTLKTVYQQGENIYFIESTQFVGSNRIPTQRAYKVCQFHPKNGDVTQLFDTESTNLRAVKKAVQKLIEGKE